MREYNAAISSAKATFTMDELQQVANGKFNKGEVLLSQSGKLVTINSHMTFTGLNNIVSTAEQNRAVREAISSALLFNNMTHGNKGSYAAAKAVSDFLKEESNRDLPLSRDELKKLIEICSPKDNSGIWGKSVDEVKATVAKELEVVRKFAEVKRKGSEAELNDFLSDTVTKELGANSRLGSDAVSWVKGLRVQKLGTRQTVMKTSDNQSIYQKSIVLKLDNPMLLAEKMTPAIYKKISPYVGDVLKFFEEAAEKTLMPAFRKGDVPSVKALKSFWLLANAKINPYLKKSGTVSADLQPFFGTMKFRAFNLMVAKNPGMIKVMLGNSSLADKFNRNLDASMDQLEADRNEAYERGDVGLENEIGTVAQFAGLFAKQYKAIRSDYVLALPKAEAVDELFRLLSIEAGSRRQNSHKASLGEIMELLNKLNTPEANQILGAFLKRLGQQVLDGKITKHDYDANVALEGICQDDVTAWMGKCSRNRVLNDLLGTNVHQPVSLMGSPERDQQLAKKLLGFKKRGNKDFEKGKIDYGLGVSERMKLLPDELKEAFAKRPKLHRLAQEMLVPPYKGRIQITMIEPESKTNYQIIGQIFHEINSLLEKFAPDVELSPIERKAYVKFATKLFLRNNPALEERLLGDENELKKGFEKFAREPVAREKIKQSRNETFSNLFTLDNFKNANKSLEELSVDDLNARHKDARTVGSAMFEKALVDTFLAASDNDDGDSLARKVGENLDKIINEPSHKNESDKYAKEALKHNRNAFKEGLGGIAKELAGTFKEDLEKEVQRMSEIFKTLNEIKSELKPSTL